MPSSGRDRLVAETARHRDHMAVVPDLRAGRAGWAKLDRQRLAAVTAVASPALSSASWLTTPTALQARRPGAAWAARTSPWRSASAAPRRAAPMAPFVVQERRR